MKDLLWYFRWWLNSRRYRLGMWLRNHEPVRCFNCGKWYWHKDVEYEVTTTGKVVPLCELCHQDLFHPFEELIL